MRESTDWAGLVCRLGVARPNATTEPTKLSSSEVEQGRVARGPYQASLAAWPSTLNIRLLPAVRIQGWVSSSDE